MAIGIMISATLTSLMTDAFNDMGYLDIYKKNVVTISSSPEKWIAENHYKSNVTTTVDYPSIFMAVESKQDFAGLINSDVYLYYKEIAQIIPQEVRGVKLLPEKMHTTILYPREVSESDDVYWLMNEKCLGNPELRELIIDEILDRYRGYVGRYGLDTAETFDNFLFKNVAPFSLLILALVLICFAVLFEVFRHTKNKNGIEMLLTILRKQLIMASQSR